MDEPVAGDEVRGEPAEEVAPENDAHLGALTKRLRRHVSLRLRELIAEEGEDAPRLVALGVSGGGDSMALLEIVASQRRHFRWAPLVVHVHHGTRGPDADADAALVAARCAALHIGHAEVRIAPPAGTTTPSEADLRRARFEAFECVLKNTGGFSYHVLLAHSLDDQAETVLHRLFRGSGPDGLAAMAPVQSVGRLTLVRPLLDVRREDLRNYLRENGLAWREDATNAQPGALRNRLRADLMPVIEREFGPSGIEHIAQFAARLRLDGELFDDITEELVASEPDYPVWIRWGRLQNLHASILSRLARRWLGDLVLSEVTVSKKCEVTAEHVERFLAFARTANPGDSIDSVGGLVLRCVRGGRFTTEQAATPLRSSDQDIAS